MHQPETRIKPVAPKIRIVCSSCEQEKCNCRLHFAIMLPLLILGLIQLFIATALGYCDPHALFWAAFPLR